MAVMKTEYCSNLSEMAQYEIANVVKVQKRIPRLTSKDFPTYGENSLQNFYSASQKRP